MDVSELAIASHDEVFELDDPTGFVALHRSRDQPTFGGIRIREYDSRSDALRDALRLSESMTRKCAINQIPGGGGKAVLVAQTIRDRTRAIAALGQFVEHLGGRFVTGPDLGFGPADLAEIQRHTRWVVREDLSAHAALGVVEALRGARLAWDGRDDLAGLTVAVQGLGAVGARVAGLLAAAGARLLVADLDPERAGAAARTLGARVVPPEEIVLAAADVLAPCGPGEVLDDEVASRLACRFVCGAANDVLTRDDVAERMAARGICYVPDFLAGSGAAVQGAWSELKGTGDHSGRVREIRERTRVIVAQARKLGVPPLRVALDLIDEYL